MASFLRLQAVRNFWNFHWKTDALFKEYNLFLCLQLTQKIEDMKKVVEEKEADISKLKSSLEQSNKEIKQLQNQHSKYLEKAAAEKKNLER